MIPPLIASLALRAFFPSTETACLITRLALKVVWISCISVVGARTFLRRSGVLADMALIEVVITGAYLAVVWACSIAGAAFWITVIQRSMCQIQTWGIQTRSWIRQIHRFSTAFILLGKTFQVVRLHNRLIPSIPRTHKRIGENIFRPRRNLPDTWFLVPPN